MISGADILLTLCALCIAVAAVPAWEGVHGRSSIGSLVPGASYIQAIGPRKYEITRYLSVQTPGSPINLTVTPNTRLAAPLFFINHNQLWQFTNETTIYSVNAVNVTGAAPLPLQLVLGDKGSGVGGLWRWRGTMLYYDLGKMGNSGLFYYCPIEGGSHGVYMFLKPSATPTGCETITLHSFSHEKDGRRRGE